MAESSSGLIRELKRKLVPQDDINGLQVASVIQHLVKESTIQACNAIEASLGRFQVEKLRFRPGKEIVDTKPIKPNPQASVKGKKAFARNRASFTTQSGATEGTKSTVSLPLSTSQELKRFDGEPVLGSDGRQQPRAPPQFLFSTLPKPKVGHQPQWSCERVFKSDVSRD